MRRDSELLTPICLFHIINGFVVLLYSPWDFWIMNHEIVLQTEARLWLDSTSWPSLKVFQFCYMYILKMKSSEVYVMLIMLVNHFHQSEIVFILASNWLHIVKLSSYCIYEGIFIRFLFYWPLERIGMNTDRNYNNCFGGKSCAKSCIFNNMQEATFIYFLLSAFFSEVPATGMIRSWRDLCFEGRYF